MFDLKKIDFIDELNRIKFMQLRASVHMCRVCKNCIPKSRKGNRENLVDSGT
jgi:hypothetical protein